MPTYEAVWLVFPVRERTYFLDRIRPNSDTVKDASLFLKTFKAMKMAGHFPPTFKEFQTMETLKSSLTAIVILYLSFLLYDTEHDTAAVTDWGCALFCSMTLSMTHRLCPFLLCDTVWGCALFCSMTLSMTQRLCPFLLCDTV